MAQIRLALAQINPTLGSFEANTETILEFARSAKSRGADLLAFGEMALSGYPLEDLALDRSFVSTAETQLKTLANRLELEGLGDLAVVVGYPALVTPQSNSNNSQLPATTPEWASPEPIAYNRAGVLYHGTVVASYDKQALPNYSVFDEPRIFQAGTENLVIEVNGLSVAIVICEDIWVDDGPLENLYQENPDLILAINASPYYQEKQKLRLKLLKNLVEKSGSSFGYVNIVGGQDELVFDGGSTILSPDGKILSSAALFSEELIFADLVPKTVYAATNSADEAIAVPGSNHNLESEQLSSALDFNETDNTDALGSVFTEPLAEIWSALVIGTRDYLQKNGFNSVVLGLSGGIDSAVCATIASDAIGAENVYGVAMPSQYSSEHSLNDAEDLAERLGLNYQVQTIEPLVAPIREQLKLEGIAAENLQARIRAVILMGISNSEGQLVLTTGNKTEVAVGYSTIYGDSIGGFAPIKDVYKTLVWELAKWRNRYAEALGLVGPIPENSISKPPSAELRPGQKDQDSLPDYEILDQIVYQLVENRLSVAEVIEKGFDEATVSKTARLIKNSEWKRRQGVLGTKITPMAFGRDRRVPVSYQIK